MLECEGVVTVESAAFLGDASPGRDGKGTVRRTRDPHLYIYTLLLQFGT